MDVSDQTKRGGITVRSIRQETYRLACLLLIAGLSALSTIPAAAAVPDCAPLYVATPGGPVPLTDFPPEMEAALFPPVFTGDTLRLLVIPVQWLNPEGYRPATYPREALDTLFFSHNVRSNGSLAEYFSEVSYGQLTVTGDVLDWYDDGIYILGCSPDAFSDIIVALDAQVDFSQYDGNGDGMVDAVIVLIAGNAQQDSQDFLHDP